MTLCQHPRMSLIIWIAPNSLWAMFKFRKNIFSFLVLKVDFVEINVTLEQWLSTFVSSWHTNLDKGSLAGHVNRNQDQNDENITVFTQTFLRCLNIWQHPWKNIIANLSVTAHWLRNTALDHCFFDVFTTPESQKKSVLLGSQLWLVLLSSFQ